MKRSKYAAINLLNSIKQYYPGMGERVDFFLQDIPNRLMDGVLFMSMSAGLPQTWLNQAKQLSILMYSEKD